MSDAAHTHDHEHDDDGPLMAHGSVLRTGISNGKIGTWLFLGSEIMFFTGLIGAYIVLRFSQDTWADPLSDTFPLNITLTAVNTFLLICSSVTLVYGLQHIQLGNRGRGNWGLFLTTLFGAVFVSVQAFEYYELWHQTDPVAEIQYSIEAMADGDKKTATVKIAGEMEEYFNTAWSKMNGPPGGMFNAGTNGTEFWSGNATNLSNYNLLQQFAELDRPDSEQEVLEGFIAHATEHWHHPTRPFSDLFGSCFYAMTGFHGFHVFCGVLAMGALTIMGLMGKFGPKNYAAVELCGLYWHFVDLVWIILFAIVYLM